MVPVLALPSSIVRTLLPPTSEVTNATTPAAVTASVARADSVRFVVIPVKFSSASAPVKASEPGSTSVDDRLKATV